MFSEHLPLIDINKAQIKAASQDTTLISTKVKSLKERKIGRWEMLIQI